MHFVLLFISQCLRNSCFVKLAVYSKMLLNFRVYICSHQKIDSPFLFPFERFSVFLHFRRLLEYFSFKGIQNLSLSH